MLRIIAFLLCVAFYSQVNGQVVQFGKCPTVKTVNLFDVERFLGTWYEIERFPAWYEDKGSCAYKHIQLCGRRIVEFQHVYVKEDIKYILHVNSTYNPGDEAVFEIEPNSIDPVGIPLSVVDTDYDNYAVLHGCRLNEVLNVKYTIAWILSRDITLQPDVLQEARTTLIKIPHTSSSFLETVDQDEAYCSHHWTANIQAVYADVGNN